jgi:DNA polymerase
MTRGAPISAKAFLPRTLTIASLDRAAKKCEGCLLYRRATQTVFGEGSEKAPAMLIGEQPGDVEDRQGRPFAGPAGKLLDRALEEAGLDRSKVYVTNAVKHFKWVERGKRRIHQKPNSAEIGACRPWVEAEIAAIAPPVIVCLGATAAQSLMGRQFRVTVDRGKFLENPWAPYLMATVHPSSLLRIVEGEERQSEYRRFVHDLESVAAKLGEIGARAR